MPRPVLEAFEREMAGWLGGRHAMGGALFDEPTEIVGEREDEESPHDSEERPGDER